MLFLLYYNVFKHLSQKFIGEQLKLVKQKEVYPQEYIDSFVKFSKDKLPDRSKFYSYLKNEYISKTDYLHANSVWNKMNTTGDYHDKCLEIYVLLLADVFEKCISTCLECHGLNPCHCFSSPGLNWDAMLKMTGTELEVIPDIHKYLFI